MGPRQPESAHKRAACAASAAPSKSQASIMIPASSGTCTRHTCHDRGSGRLAQGSCERCAGRCTRKSKRHCTARMRGGKAGGNGADEARPARYNSSEGDETSRAARVVLVPPLPPRLRTCGRACTSQHPRGPQDPAPAGQAAHPATDAAALRRAERHQGSTAATAAPSAGRPSTAPRSQNPGQRMHLALS